MRNIPFRRGLSRSLIFREEDHGREARVTINGFRAAVWAAITNIENAADIVRGIEKIEVPEKPAIGLAGLRRLGTRMYFGEPAIVE